MPLDKADLIKALASFIVVDVVFRQALSRFDTVLKMRIESLGTGLRPALRLLSKTVKEKRTFTETERVDFIKTLDAMKPFPHSSLRDLARGSGSSGDLTVNDLQDFLKTIEAEEKKVSKLAGSYSAPFITLNSAQGFVPIVTLIIYAGLWAWIPSLFAWYFEIFPSWAAIISFLPVLCVEIQYRRGKRPIDI